jgi:tetratricopeptide (TPR) repeat protein
MKIASVITEAIRLEPDFALAYASRGNIFALLQQNDKAISDYSEAIRLKSDFSDAYYNRGNIFLAVKQYVLAISDFNSAIMIRQDAKYYHNRGLAYQMLGQAEQAKHDLEKAQQLGSGH